MMYLHKPSRSQLSRDIAGFIQEMINGEVWNN